MALKRTQADKYFSDCVRLRSNWHCEYCGQSMEHNKQNLECSHFISRGYNIIRYNPFNAFAHCHQCHEKLGGGRWGGGNVAEFADHYDQVFSQGMREYLRLLSKHPFPKHQHYVKEISDHYRKQKKIMIEKRAAGETDRLPFEAYTNPILDGIKREVNG